MMRAIPLIESGRTLVPKCYVAEGFFSRLMGLMGRKTIPPDEALAFPRCNSIHTFFMRFAIDVVFVDGSGKVVRVIESLKPWRMLVPQRGARHVIEFRGSRCKELGIREGMQLDCEGAWA